MEKNYQNQKSLDLLNHLPFNKYCIHAGSAVTHRTEESIFDHFETLFGIAESSGTSPPSEKNCIEAKSLVNLKRFSRLVSFVIIIRKMICGIMLPKDPGGLLNDVATQICGQ